MFVEAVGAGDAGADLASAAVAALRSTTAVRGAADAVELRSIATLVQVRRSEAAAAARRRRSRVGSVRPERVDVDLVDRCTAQEVSVALCLSPVAARARLELALELVERRPATFEALRTGAVDLVRARRIVEAVRTLAATRGGDRGDAIDTYDRSTMDLRDSEVAGEPGDEAGTPAQATASDDLASSVEAEVLRPGSVPLLADLRPGRPAGELTPAQLTARLNRLVLRADPGGATARTAVADAARGCTLRALPDGMALLSVTGRAELLHAAFARVDATARDLMAADASSGTDRASAATGRDGAGGVQVGPRHGVDAARGLDRTRVDVLLACLLGHSWDIGQAAGVTVSLAVVAPAGTVLAGGDEPGELVGYGPLPAPLVRELAGDAAWTRWSSERTTGQVVGVGRRRYRPSTAVATLVRARDARCRFPTCRRSAVHCDLDHVVPFPAGSTCSTNLASECRLHHLCKHRGGFTMRMDAGGTVVWTTPTGQEVVDHPPSWGRPPPVTDQDGPAGTTPVADPDEPPPF